MTRTSFFSWAGALSLWLAGQPAVGQIAFTLDGSGTRVAYADGPGITAWAFTPGIQLVRPWQSFGASGTYAQFPDGSWSLRGQTAGSAFSPPILGFRGEAAGSMSGTLYQDHSRSGQYLGTLRLHWLGARAGAWAGGSVGNAWNGVGWLATRRGEVGGWMRLGIAALTVTVSPTAIGESVRYADLESAVQLTSGPTELLASGGLRRWTDTPGVASSAWGMASGAYWVNRHVAIVASVGTYPADYAQGLPNGTYASLGLRVATRRPSVAPTPDLRAQLLAADGTRRGAPAIEVRPGAGGVVTLTLAVPGAETVQIMGDFTGWTPVAFTQVGAGRWSVTLPIPAGSHRMNIRIDGGAWGVPTGVPSLSDEFSGVVGLLIIE